MGFTDFLLSTIGSWGYFGIFVLMTLESSFFPFPSELVIIPAGYLAFLGKMNLSLIILVGIFGSIFGAWVNYLIAYKFGRKIIIKLIKKERLNKMELFFKKHGDISTFNGRLIPIVRQYISFPAGLARMNYFKFTIYTAVGATIWVCILALLGYLLGQNQELIHKYLKEITIILLFLVFLITLIYVYLNLSKNKKDV